MDDQRTNRAGVRMRIAARLGFVMVEGLILLAIIVLTPLIGVALIMFGKRVFGSILICASLGFVLLAWLTPPSKK